MISRAEQIWLKRAQAAAHLEDAEYREALQQFAHVRSSTDPRMTHDQFERLMGYFEAIHWRLRESGAAQPSDVCRRRGYWAERCHDGDANRARFAMHQQTDQIHELERDLIGSGVSVDYLDGIRVRSMSSPAHPDTRDLAAYRAALRRTLAARLRKEEHEPAAV
jgi:hypothetical protein